MARLFKDELASAKSSADKKKLARKIIELGGQADYSAANDALDCLANVATHRRVLAVDWGPWAGGGMVSPELEREYARRGIGLVDPADGAAFLADQIKAGLPNRQVMFMRADPVAVGAVVVSEAVLHGR